jgi:hypothetical protein
MKKLFGILLVMALVLSFSLVTATPVAAATINVPGDYSTIDAAINAANPGDTIQVAAGTYDEQVVINKSLTLQGAGDTTIIKPSADNLTQVFTGLFWYGGTKNIAGIVVANVPGGSSVSIKNLKVDESLVTAKPTGADYLAGIFYRETGGLVDTVTVAGTGAWSSSDKAYGIYLSAGTKTVSVEITDSIITNFDKNGIEVMGSKLTADINHNRITGRGSITDEIQNGVNVGRDAVATVNYNTISKLIYQPKTSWGAGIMFYNYVSPTGVSDTANNNNIIDCQTGIIFNNANASAEGNIVDGGAVGLIGIYAEPDAAGEWTASFIGNTISGVRDSGSYQNAAIGANTYHVGATLTVTIDNNQLESGSASADGISIGVEGADGAIVATITNNNISGWEYGIRLGGALVDATSSCANSNSISGNDVFGVYNGGTGTLNATCNWWGDDSGPSGEGPGMGDAVSNNVDFEPWVIVPTVTTQAATDVLVYVATLNMNYTAGSCYSPVQVRFAYKKAVGTQWSYTDWVSKTADGTNAETLTGLDPNTGYQFKAQLKYNGTLLEGNTLTFVTQIVPTVTTQAATNITSYSANVSMSYTAGDFSLVEVRFACKRTIDQAWFYTAWVSGTADYTYTEVLTGLASRTEYELKAQLRYPGNMIEGATCRFTTAAGASIGFYDLFCSIATAAYGTPTAEQIDVLREFRDVVLYKSTMGSQFVALYYRLSPPIADFIARSDLLRTLVRELLVDPVVWIVEATGDIWRN